MSSRSVTTLRSLIAESRDGEWGKGEPFEDCQEMAVIRGTDFNDVRTGLLDSLPVRFIPGHIAVRKTLRPNDILIETAGGSKDRPTGRTLFLGPSAISRPQLPLMCASFSRFIRIDPQKAYPGYVFWVLQQLYSAGHMTQYHTQHTGVARFQFTVFAETENLPLPPRVVQERVATILSAYDDLIENNTRRIRILEEMAQRIYREWFVHFRFPGHKKVKLVPSPLGLIPQGWEISTFGRNFEIKYGKNLPTRHVTASGRFPVCGAGGVLGFYDDAVANAKVTLITCRGNGSGTVWRTRQAAFITNNSLMILPKPHRKSWEYFCIELVTRHSNVRSALGGSAQPQVTIEELSSVSVIIPSSALVERFCELVSPMPELVDRLHLRNENLRKTRDLLLPKLISGKLDVSDLDINVGDAAA